jgi:peptide/nickel transport system substrate-binding protein
MFKKTAGTSRTGRRVFSAVASLSLLTGVLVGCSSSSGGAGGTLTFLTNAESWTHADPNRNYTGQHIAWFGSFMHRTLTAYARAEGAAGSEVVPDLATDTGRASNGNKTWEFTLRDGAKFEDGSEITCADVKYGVSRTFATDVITDGPTYAISMLDIPKDAEGASVYKGPYKADGNDTAAYDKAVTCSEDNKTITFNLSRPVGDFNYTVTYLSFSPVPQAKDNGDQYDLAPVSSGPYKIEKYKAKEEMVLVRNENWSKDSDPIRNAYPDKIVVRFGVAEEVRDQLILNDSEPAAFSLDAILPTNLATVFNEDGTPKEEWKSRALNVYDPYVTYTAVNVGKVPCVQVRKAIYYARDFAALQQLGGGAAFGGDPADGVIKPLMGLDYKPVTGLEDFKPEGNAEKAQALMAEAKSACPDVYAKATGAGLTFDVADSDTNKKSATIWIDSVKKNAGINLKFNFIEPGQYYAVVLDPTKQGDLSRAGWAPDWANASTVIPELFLEGAGFPLSNVGKDPAYAEFKSRVEANLSQSDRTAQGAEWAALNQYVMDQMWVIPGVFSKTQEMWGSKLEGIFFWEPQGAPSFGDIKVKS